MLSVSSFEFSQRDLLGHGAFALVFKGRRKKASLLFVACVCVCGGGGGGGWTVSNDFRTVPNFGQFLISDSF